MDFPMNRLLLLLAMLLTTAGCMPDGTFGDDDDVTSDDDDSAGDDDDATSDDDDATSDDDDSTEPVVPCRNPPPLDESEWSLLSEDVLFDGGGGYPDIAGNAWSWFIPTESVARARFDEFGPLSGPNGQEITSGTELASLFDENKQDLVVVSMIVQASGECGVPVGVYMNDLLDCICFGGQAHWDEWSSKKPKPAFTVRTRVFSLRDQGFDDSPDAVSMSTEETRRSVDPPTP